MREELTGFDFWECSWRFESEVEVWIVIFMLREDSRDLARGLEYHPRLFSKDLSVLEVGFHVIFHSFNLNPSSYWKEQRTKSIFMTT